MLPLVVGKGQGGCPGAKERMQARGCQEAHQVSAEDVGKAATDGEKVAFLAHIRQHRPEEWGNANQEDQTDDAKADCV